MIDTQKYCMVPFQDCGRGNPGYDCWGLVKAVYADMNIKLPSYDLEYFSATDRIVPALIDRERSKWHRVNDPQEGDVVLLKIKNFPRHVGIITKPGWMLHALKTIGICHERYTGLMWKNRINGFYRYHTDHC
jgi:cell wall-associated NlpC family hydrolase